MTTRNEIQFSELPRQTTELSGQNEILVSVGGEERRALISLLPRFSTPSGGGVTEEEVRNLIQSALQDPAQTLSLIHI